MIPTAVKFENSRDPFAGGPRPRIAIVHDWLVTPGGAETVLGHLIRMFPDADVYAAVDNLPLEHRGFLAGKQVRTTFVQSLPFAKRWYWYYSPAMPLAYERLNLGSYDLVLSSCYAFAKCVLPQPDQLHLCYAHSTPRFLYDLQEDYLDRFVGAIPGVKLPISILFHHLRLADLRGAQGVDSFIANSSFVQRRIEKTYRRNSVVIHPGVELDRFQFSDGHDDFYLAGSFMNPFKRLDVIVKAFADLPDRRLVVFGDGPQRRALEAIATPNVKLVGRLSNHDLAACLARARAYIFAAPEDFGIIMVEAQACGTPVIAYAVGGAKEIVRDLGTENPTGVLFNDSSAEGVMRAIRRFEACEATIVRAECRMNAERFSVARFEARFLMELFKRWCAWRTRMTHDSLDGPEDFRRPEDSSVSGGPG